MTRGESQGRVAVEALFRGGRALGPAPVRMKGVGGHATHSLTLSLSLSLGWRLSILLPFSSSSSFLLNMRHSLNMQYVLYVHWTCMSTRMYILRQFPQGRHA